MRDLSIEEAKEMIGNLLDSLELATVLIAAQKAVLTVQGKSGWGSQVLQAQEMLAPHFGEVFLPLRELLLGSSAVQSSEIDWHQIVQNLIESANNNDPD